jgi:hypothetical protein
MSELKSVEAMKELSAAINVRATEIFEGNGADAGELADAKDMARALARLLSGEGMRSAFGSPGDWGYSTRIGKALQACFALGSHMFLATVVVAPAPGEEVAGDGR